MPTAWQGTPAGPASARAASLPGGERRANRKGGAGETQGRTKDPMTAASLGPGLAQGAALTAQCDVLSGGTVDILCDSGLVTYPLWAAK